MNDDGLGLTDQKAVEEPPLLEEEVLDEQVSEEQVASYLISNPDFFTERDDLLTRLTIPHQRGDTISLVERQLTVLRERNHGLRERLNNLMNIARDNDRLFERVRRLVLSVNEAETLDSIIDAVDDSLSHDFRIDYVSQILASEAGLSSRVACFTKRDICDGVGVSDLLESNRVVCGKLREKELRFLFPEHWKLVKSSAVVPLYYKRPLGVLAVGSRESDDFRVGTGTVYLGFIGEVISRALEGILPAPLKRP